MNRLELFTFFLYFLVIKAKQYFPSMYIKTDKANKRFNYKNGSRKESEVVGFFVFSQ